MPLPQRLRHLVSKKETDLATDFCRSELGRLLALTQDTLGLPLTRIEFSLELTCLKAELQSILKELAYPIASEGAIFWLDTFCSSLDKQAAIPLDSTPLCMETDGATRLLVAEVMSSRERLSLLKQASRSLAALQTATPSPPTRAPTQTPSPSSVKLADDPIAGAAAELGLDVSPSAFVSRKRFKLTKDAQAILIEW